MTVKLRKTEHPSPRGGKGYMHIFWCPGCQSHMWIDEGWTITGTPETPTVMPSVLARSENENGKTVCHLFIRNGRLEFLNDCTHELAGKTVEMEEARCW